ncbi:MAG: response regulator transcription factor [Lentilitoribacter sp.]
MALTSDTFGHIFLHMNFLWGNSWRNSYALWVRKLPKYWILKNFSREIREKYFPGKVILSFFPGNFYSSWLGKINLVLLDYEMPRTDGLQGLKMIQQQYPQQIVGMLSGRTDPQLVKSAIDGGAIGWLPKSMSEEPLLHALRMMAAGGQFIPREVLEELKQYESRWGDLTPTETQVAQLVADGHSDKEIAAQLDMAPNTVRNHVRAVLTKAGVENRAKFAVMYQKNAL